jgi:hypothetical protein
MKKTVRTTISAWTAPSIEKNRGIARGSKRVAGGEEERMGEGGAEADDHPVWTASTRSEKVAA